LELRQLQSGNSHCNHYQSIGQAKSNHRQSMVDELGQNTP
jgi:hypothetical protein